MTAQEEVRAAWKWFYFHNGNFYIFDNAHKIPGSELFAGSTDATLAFTRQRQQEIAELEEEIERIQDDLSIWPNSHNGLIYQRTLSRLQAILAEKSRGLKGAQ